MWFKNIENRKNKFIILECRNVVTNKLKFGTHVCVIKLHLCAVLSFYFKSVAEKKLLMLKFAKRVAILEKKRKSFFNNSFFILIIYLPCLQKN